VRPAIDQAPGRWETGTQNHEGLAGLVGVIDYLALLGREQASHYRDAFKVDAAGRPYSARQRELRLAMQAIVDYERALSAQLLAGLREIKDVQVYGITNPQGFTHRVPTVACNIRGHTPRELAEYLAGHGIFAWDGNYYALGIMERLGLEEHGGALRLGMVHYNTPEEINRVLDALERLPAH
jgi:selenocysteine lyase/cysteine desulfurase